MTTILHLATNETAISVGSLSFFVVVGLTPSDRFVITFLSPEKFLFLFHNYPVVFDNLRPIIVKLLFFLWQVNGNESAMQITGHFLLFSVLTYFGSTGSFKIISNYIFGERKLVNHA